jgi:cardiolipin synthase A/B
MANPPVLRGGHTVRLLEGSREYFPALVEAMDAARFEIRLETYIFDFTGAGGDVAAALVRAAQRGVMVQVVVDGFGTEPVPGDWQLRFDYAGVQWRVYSPLGRFGLLLPSHWRRLHRKLAVIDGRIGFCGGINVLDDFHDPNHGRLEAPRFDFAVQVSGPLVHEMHEATAQLWLRMRKVRQMSRRELVDSLTALRNLGRAQPGDDDAQKQFEGAGHESRAVLVLRDNLRNRTRIEKAYRQAIGQARREIVIANAYFLPGRKLRKALIMAAKRGVKVRLLLQGKYEYFMQYYAARPVYGDLLHAGVEIHEYAASFLHAKVAVIDGHWATVGSSNLDPLSLLLAREANVMVDDPGFATSLLARLEGAIADGGKAMDPQLYGARPLRQRIFERVALLIMRALLFVQGKSY